MLWGLNRAHQQGQEIYIYIIKKMKENKLHKPPSKRVFM
jgi:hypothetical protein